MNESNHPAQEPKQNNFRYFIHQIWTGIYTPDITMDIFTTQGQEFNYKTLT